MEEIPKKIELILVSLFSGTATEDEIQALREWIKESELHSDILKKYYKVNFLLQVRNEQKRYDSEIAWRKITPIIYQGKSTGKKTLKNVTKWFYRIAALFILSFSCGMICMFYVLQSRENNQKDDLVFEYTIPYGSKGIVLLPDSSKVWLNAGSTLRHSADFNKTDRSVYIEGEAYFNVAKNMKKPFYVETGTISLQVLGTSFNVKAYPEENILETTVETGRVQILGDSKDQKMDKMILEAGQKATIIKSSVPEETNNAMAAASDEKQEEISTPIPGSAIEKMVITRNVDTEIYTSWKDQRWIIEKESLEKLAVKLERRFNVKILITDEQVREYTFSGTLEDETLEQVMAVIKLSAPIDFEVKQNQVTLFHNKWFE